MKLILTAQEHYDRLAEMGNDLNDPPAALEYMARWDGPAFWKAIGETRGKDVLEIGIGTGRIARQLLQHGCRSLTGLDVSPKTIEVAKSQLSDFSNAKPILADVAEFCQPASFDIACSVLTFMHIQDKAKALENIVNCLRPGGHLVLSIDNASSPIDFGEWMIPLYPWAPERYTQALGSMGCEVDDPIPLIDKWTDPQGKKTETYGQEIAALIKATRTGFQQQGYAELRS
jgi:SAM-dependent methyltransferase